MRHPVTNQIDKLYASKYDVLGLLGDSREKMPLRAGLGNVANIAAAMPRRVKNYRLLSASQHLLIANDVRARKGGKHRTRVCHRNRQYGADSVILRLTPAATDSAASLSGLQTCGSVWACPVCAPRIASERGKEVQQALDWAKENDLIPVMMTLTARHTGEMSLDHIKTRFKAAWRFFTKARAWRRFRADFGVEHTITAREILYAWQSGNGWHYHMHTLLFIRRDAMREAIETDMQAELRPDWLAALARHELEAIGEYGLNVSAHGDVPGKYLAKLGLNPEQPVTDARYEISGAGNKQGRQGVNVWTLLERSQRRDSAGTLTPGAKLAEKCYLEYVVSMQGDDWITWSRGFKALVGMDEQPDEQLAETDDDPAANDWLHLDAEQWQPVAKSRDYAGLLSVAAETRSKAAVMAFIDELRDAATLHYPPAAPGHTSPRLDEQPSSFSSSPPGDQDRRDQLQQLLIRLSRWQADRALIRSIIRSHERHKHDFKLYEHSVRELALYNRMIADGQAKLETLTYV